MGGLKSSSEFDLKTSRLRQDRLAGVEGEELRGLEGDRHRNMTQVNAADAERLSMHGSEILRLAEGVSPGNRRVACKSGPGNSCQRKRA
jgi:hypothetical protein